MMCVYLACVLGTTVDPWTWTHAGALTAVLSSLSRAGKDAARAYGTGCFQTHLTHDLRGLSDSEMRVRES